MSYLGWNIPIERQQYLAEAVRVQLQTLGYSTPVNQESLNWMMQLVSAYPYEADFVAQQMLYQRQQYLAYAIANTLQGIGRVIPVTQENLIWMMQQIGAQEYEANMVAQQMQQYLPDPVSPSPLQQSSYNRQSSQPAPQQSSPNLQPSKPSPQQRLVEAFEMKADYYDGMVEVELETQEKYQRFADEDRRRRERQEADLDSRRHAADEAYARGNHSEAQYLLSKNMTDAMSQSFDSSISPHWQQLADDKKWKAKEYKRKADWARAFAKSYSRMSSHEITEEFAAQKISELEKES